MMVQFNFMTIAFVIMLIVAIIQKSKIKRLEKQCEQKPVEKVEPKFKVGDWVIRNGEVLQISAIDKLINGIFHYWFTRGTWLSSLKIDEEAHLWTIQDAKDGDVLEFGDHGRLVVGIVSYVNKTTGKVDVNCLLENNNFKVGNYYNLDTIKPHPATKEQRDLLLQKMKEAGYEWDAEKKELKKIEQKPAWSEEEKKKLDRIYYILGIAADEHAYSNTCRLIGDKEAIELQDFLRSIAKPEQKPAWSEEDEDMLKSIIATCELAEQERDSSPARHLFEMQSNWLESLKERYTWKPSEEQMDALETAVSSLQSTTLESLYNDLKKLREE